MRLSSSPTSILAFLLLCVPSSWVVVNAITPDLPLGDINVLVVTDVHSYIGGHPHASHRDADYGDIMSFYEHLKQYCNEQGTDLWFVNNGDFIHGTGLAMDGNATNLVPLLTEMPFDVYTMGNHEAYYSDVVELIEEQMLPKFGDGYITSNVLSTTRGGDGLEAFGSRYKLLKGVNNTLLTFGFLYNVEDVSGRLKVVPVESALEEDWFAQALKEEEYDAILVMAHMRDEDPLVAKILTAIQKHVGDDMPVQFVTGHSHKRAVSKRAFWSRSIEAGGHLDTLGFVSFPTQKTGRAATTGRGKMFQGRLLNTSKAVLTDTLGVDSLKTANGTAFSKKILATRTKLGLLENVGCPPQSYFRDRPIDAHDSIWKLWKDHVVPTQICKRKTDCIMMISTDSWRDDIVEVKKNSPLTVDEIVSVAPFMESLYYVGKVPEWAIRRMYMSLNTDSMQHRREMPDFIMYGDLDADMELEEYDLYTHGYNVPLIKNDLTRFHIQNLEYRRTEQRDTLYWLNYAAQAWPCTSHPVQVDPWFSHIDLLEEEATDGHRSSDESLDEEYDDDSIPGNSSGGINDHSGGKKKGGKHKGKDKEQSEYHYEGYHGYVPPDVAEKFSDKLPPEAAKSQVLKPSQHAQNAPKKKVRHSNAANKAERAAKRKKIRRILGKIFAVVVAIGLLITPLIYLFQLIFGKDRGHFDDDDDEIFYDQSEIRSLRKANKKRGQRGGSQNRPGSGGARGGLGASRRPRSEIEIT